MFSDPYVNEITAVDQNKLDSENDSRYLETLGQKSYQSRFVYNHLCIVSNIYSELNFIEQRRVLGVALNLLSNVRASRRISS